MSNDTLEQQETTNEVTLEDLTYFEAEDGLFIFMADREDICDIIERIGFQIYYLISNKIVKSQPPNNNKHTNNNKTSNSYTSTSTTNVKPVPAAPPPPDVKNFAIYKVCNSFVGRTVQEAEVALPDNFVSIAPLAHYTMPLIPHIIVDKLDQFFRLVDAQHSTESIVMLTYDLDKEGPEGWGVLVPDQENTAAHCNYDPHSVAEVKPDNVMIVGSVHSHPHMSAYASGTDHADQADFDGIHITYGWQKTVNNGATQYHIELQMAGQAYTLKPEDVFEDFVIQKEPDPDVVEWSTKVKKELPPSLPAGGYRGGQVLGNPPAKTPHGKMGGAGNSIKHWSNSDFFNSIKDQLVTPCIIAYELPYNYNEIYKESVNCMVCGVVLDHYSIVDHICDICNVPIFTKDEPIKKVIDELAYYAYQYQVDLNVPAYIVGGSNNSIHVSRITPTTLKEYLTDDSLDSIAQLTVDNEIENEVPDYQSPVCCSAVDIVDCFCETTLTAKDFRLFMDTSASYDFYAKKSVCVDCEHYLEDSCPYLVDIAVNFKTMVNQDPNTHISELEAAENVIDGTDCKYFEKYDNNLDIYDNEGWSELYYG